MSAAAEKILNGAFQGGGGEDFLRAHADMETEDNSPRKVIPLSDRSEVELRNIVLHDPDLQERRAALDLLIAMRVAEAIHRVSASSLRAERDDVFRAA